MRHAILLLGTLAAACGAGGSPLDAGDGGGGGDDPDAGGPPGGTWTGTASVHTVDFDGHVDDVVAAVTWREQTRDEDGVDYLPTGTVSIARTVPGCTVTFEPASHPIVDEADGFLRVDAASYRGAGGTTWTATVTITCPPNAPAAMTMLVGGPWLDAASPRPLDAPDRISGHQELGTITRDWSFTRAPR